MYNLNILSATATRKDNEHHTEVTAEKFQNQPPQ